MTRKTYRLRIQLDGDTKPQVYRTDGVPTHCCSFDVSFFTWEKNTKYNHYQGWSGYISYNALKKGLANYNPDNLVLD